MGRPSTTGFGLPWRGDDPCPCGGGRPFGQCCSSLTGKPQPALLPITPPLPKTGFSHPGCYLGSSFDCSPRLSREHYISKGLLKGQGLKVRGMPWWPGEAKPITPDHLTARILCQRHNSALSPLDAAAEWAFKVLGEAIGHASKKSLARRTIHRIISGEALELWAMKTMAGVAASGIDFKLGEHRVQEFATPMEAIVSSLTAPKPISRVILSIPLRLDQHEPSLGRAAVSLGPMLDPVKNTNTGLIVRMHGLTLDFGFDLEPEEGAMVRPDMIDFHGPLRTARVHLGWPDHLRVGQIAEIRLGIPRPAARGLGNARKGLEA